MASQLNVDISPRAARTSPPMLSVLMPVYNGERYLAAAIQSIINQDFPSFELVIVDDGSTDRSANIIKSFDDNRIKLIAFQENQGIAQARNAALRHSAGKYIAILDCDDLACPRRLARQVEFLENNPDHVLVAGRAEIIDEEGRPTGNVWGNERNSEFISEILLFQNCLVQSTVCMRREGIPDEGYRHLDQSEDFDLWVRMAHTGKVAILPHVVVQYRLHRASTSRSKRESAAKTRRRVLLTQLQALGIDPTASEVAFHESLSKYGFQLDDSNRQEARDWLEEIITANRASSYLEVEKLATVVQSLWLSINGHTKSGPWFYLGSLASCANRSWGFVGNHVEALQWQDAAISDPQLTVAVCTYNRADLLPNVLESLAAQSLGPERYEVLIVDNNSSDITREIALQFCKSLPNARYVFEAEQGLSHARNRAIAEARGQYVAFLDDDAQADSAWCERILQAFSHILPSPVAVGGCILPWYQREKPAWFLDEFENRSWGDEPGFSLQGKVKHGFSGSNMAISKAVLKEFGGFAADFGMKGGQLGLGEEAHFFSRVWARYPGRFWYDPAMMVRHYVPTRNMTLTYQLRRLFVSGRTGARIANDPPNGWIHLRTLTRPIKLALLSPFRAYRSKWPFRAALVAEGRKVMYALGWAVERTPGVAGHVFQRRRMRLDAFMAKLARPLRKLREHRRYRKVSVDPNARFHIVTCGRNTGTAILKCLDSVYTQRFERANIKHYVIDDASDDGTREIIETWLKEHPDHSVEFHANEVRKGGTHNTRDGLRAADEGAIVLELNADDWLADEHVLSFLSKVYREPQVWMTYNSYAYSSGTPSERRRPYPKYVVKKSSYRDYEWICQHLHSFRSALLSHLPDNIFLDPETGDFLSKADDRSIYWSLLELCGKHAVHLERTLYIYDFHENTDLNLDPTGSKKNVLKIQQMKRYSPLESL